MNLYDYVDLYGAIKEYECSKITTILLQSLYYLHQLGIVHRDIKADNVMLQLEENSPIIKSVFIIDFGLACYIQDLQSIEKQKELCGTINYIAPEIIFNNETYDQRCDLYSLGIVMYYMLVG